VRVPAASLLDRFATIDAHGTYASPIASASKRFFTMLGTLVGGRVCVGSAGVSVAKSALAIAVRYALAREQFGPEGGPEVPLMTYPSHRRRLLPGLASSYVLHFAFDRLRERFAEVQAQQEPDTRELEAEAAGLKAIATWHATRVVQQCREACGGQGYLAVNRLADLKADSDVFATFEGDNTVLLQLVGKSLLGRFARQLGSGGALGMLRMLSRVATTAVVEKNPIEVRRTDRAHLRDRAFHLAALSHREQTLVRAAALRIRKRVRAKASPHEAFLDVQEHVLAASHAYVERLALEWFEQRARTVADEDTRAWLARLGDLHALSILERDAGWYLEDGYVDAWKARAIRKEVEALLAEIAPAARALVDAFGIPDACLAAPIAFFDPARPLDGMG
jgi:acyl-CoA oxidase